MFARHLASGGHSPHRLVPADRLNPPHGRPPCNPQLAQSIEAQARNPAYLYDNRVRSINYGERLIWAPGVCGFFGLESLLCMPSIRVLLVAK
jgi:hypothetical protein